MVGDETTKKGLSYCLIPLVKQVVGSKSVEISKSLSLGAATIVIIKLIFQKKFINNKPHLFSSRPYPTTWIVYLVYQWSLRWSWAFIWTHPCNTLKIPKAVGVDGKIIIFSLMKIRFSLESLVFKQKKRVFQLMFIISSIWKIQRWLVFYCKGYF